MGFAFYTTGNDRLDVDKLMKDPIIVKGYMDCYLNRAPCSPLAQSYKNILEDSLKSSCKRCSNLQKHLWSRFLWNLRTRYPKYFNLFQKRYDPNNHYIPALQKIVGNEKKYTSFKETYKYTAFAMAASLSYPNPKYLKKRIFIFCEYFVVICQNYKEQMALQIINEIDRDYALYNNLPASYQQIIDTSIRNSLIYSERGWIITVLSVVLVFPIMAGIKTTYSYLFTSEPQRFMIHDIRTPNGSSEDRFKSPYYEIMFAYMLYAASTYVFSFIGYDGFFGLSVNHACLKMKIYCKMFEDALKSKDNIYGNIRQVIAEQNRLFKLVNLIQDTFNIWLGLILIATMIQLCNCMYTLTTGGGFDLKYTIFVIGSVIHIFLPCLYSAKLKETSLETATLIYCAGWEDIYETKIRKVVQIMIARSQRPLEIVAFNIKIFDMDLFVSILQTSYSVYTLLRS
ncbi:uncharacterized protein LOC119831916 [Zerene cesonia]|uniref:uncharacterized protein LOC119831916 n=1 Tax=Zerene cesonia TaxID=33412 RepID=UPI0018E51B51|nr:uncharacterized protein LOC119831916 [Zerene cesonia]